MLSPTVCFDFAMEDSAINFYEAASFYLHDAETNNVVGTGSLVLDQESVHKQICLDATRCYTLQVFASGDYPGQITWSFGGTMFGGAPYGPSAIWVDSGALQIGGGGCPTPAPTRSFKPTPAPTSTPVPSTSASPSPVPTTPSPTAAVRFVVDDFDELLGASQVPYAAIEVTSGHLDFASQIEITSTVTMFSATGTTLFGSGTFRHLSLSSGSRLMLSRLTLKNGRAPDVSSGGGSIYAAGAPRCLKLHIHR